MPRSFLVKKKTGIAGMPRPVSVGSPELSPRVEHHILPAPRIPLSGLPCPNIFSPAKLCTAPEVPVQCQQSPVSASSLSPERCSSRCSSSGSLTPEPINYSMSPRSTTSTGSVTPTWSSPASSPRLSPDTCWTPTAAPSTSPASADLAHLPFLALSFKRLQEMHMQAVESRLQGITMSPPRGAAVAPPAAHSPTHYSPVSPVSSPSSRCAYPAMSPPTMMTSPGGDSRGTDLSLSPVLPPHGALQHQHTTSPFSSWAAAAAARRCVPSVEPHHPMETSTQEAAPMSEGTNTTTPSKRKSNDPPRYQCEACNKSYATFSGLSKHKQFHCTALIKKEFVCKHCDKKYHSLGALKMHIRTHTLPCSCHICGKSFSRPWLLQGHVRTHTGEKPFPCEHCGRSFADRSNLRAHLQTHTDIKKYNCRNCSKSFSRSSLLHKHMDNGCGAASPLVRAL